MCERLYLYTSACLVHSNLSNAGIKQKTGLKKKKKVCTAPDKLMDAVR